MPAVNDRLYISNACTGSGPNCAAAHCCRGDRAAGLRRWRSFRAGGNHAGQLQRGGGRGSSHLMGHARLRMRRCPRAARARSRAKHPTGDHSRDFVGRADLFHSLRRYIPTSPERRDREIERAIRRPRDSLLGYSRGDIGRAVRGDFVPRRAQRLDPDRRRHPSCARRARRVPKIVRQAQPARYADERTNSRRGPIVCSDRRKLHARPHRAVRLHGVACDGRDAIPLSSHGDCSAAADAAWNVTARTDDRGHRRRCDLRVLDSDGSGVRGDRLGRGADRHGHPGLLHHAFARRLQPSGGGESRRASGISFLTFLAKLLRHTSLVPKGPAL